MSDDKTPEAAESQSAQGSYIAQARENSIAIVSVLEYRSPPPVNPEELAAAELRLAKLPTDIIPPRVSTPINWISRRLAEARQAASRQVA